VLDLAEALGLTALIALHDRARGERYALRWLARWLESQPEVALDEVVLVAAALRALGGEGHAEALMSLRAVAGRAIRRPPVRRAQ
jgi:hypothetical protein